MTTWIVGGRVVDPVRETVEDRDLLVVGERIQGVVPRGIFRPETESEVVDASGCLVLPGLIDMHVHLREPGQEYKETIATGGRAGISGGFVSLACMPNTDPVNDRASVTGYVLRKAHEAKTARIFPVGAITKGLRGEELTDFGELRASGAVAVSDDGKPVVDSELMRAAMVSASRNGLTIISHCEDFSLSAGGVMHEGSVSASLGYPGIPPAAEESMVRREISLSRESHCPVHLAHLSTAGSVRLVREAKEDGLSITAETAPHYFTLDHTAVVEYSTNAKMNPPLRTPEDIQAVKEALAKDIIDVIATDHAPHGAAEKEIAFEKAAFGIIGLETALPLTLDLVRQGLLTLPQAVRKLSYAPAKVLGLEGGRIVEGGMADLAIVDPEFEYVLKKEDIQSRSRNSPFIGRTLKGRNLLTMVGGRIVWKR